MEVNNLKFNEEKIRDLYLRGLLTGKIQGPLTGKISQDKPWLIHYTDEQIRDYNDGMFSGNCDCSIYDYMLEENKQHLDDVALYYFGRKFTYRELIEKSDMFAASVIKKGIKPGDVVTICMPNTPEAVFAFYGLNKIGVIANMIHPLSSPNEIKNCLNESNSKVIVTMDIALDKVKNVLADTNVETTVVVSADNSMPNLLKAGYRLKNGFHNYNQSQNIMSFNSFLKQGTNTKISRHPFNKNEVAVMLHTGGTTGISKAACLTNENFNSMVEQFKYIIPNFDRGDKMLTIMPVFHGFGLCSSLHLPLSYGVGCILIPKLNAQDIGKIFKKYHPNHILGVPTLFKGIIKCSDLANEDLSYVKNIVSGGDVVKDSFESKINSFFKNHGASVVLEKGYGLTEAVAGATFSSGDYNDYGTVGIPMIGTSMKLVKPGTDEEVTIGEMGEICLKGPTIMSGYYNQEKENETTIREGWLYTGDLGSMPQEQLNFHARKGDIIISSGVNVYPKRIEKVIEEHKDVSACAVIGVADDYRGEVPKAFIVLNEGIHPSEMLQEEIDSLCKNNLDRYSIPKKIEYVSSLPQTKLGKVSKKDLRQMEDDEPKVYIKK